jgi:molybdate transport system substrate-binding protein
MNSIRALWLLLALLPCVAHAKDVLTVAVASNFQTTARALATQFTESTGISVRLSAGSTGKLYAQIVNGAPFDVFLAADAARPRRLEEAGQIVSGSRMTYALGSLLLWSADSSLLAGDCRAALEAGAYTKLAIANPDTAPYGLAAQQFLINAGLYEAAKSRLVYGESIAQALNFVATGNATLGLIAASQVAAGLPVETSCSWPVPTNMHAELEQQAVVLLNSRNADAAAQFMRYLRSAEARSLLKRDGYEVAE